MPDTSWSRSLNELHPPRKVGWSPTLGYATVDREVLALCEAALKVLEGLGTEIVDVDPVFDEDPGMPWLTLAMASRRAHASATCAAPTTGSGSTPGTSRSSSTSGRRPPAPR